MFGYAPVKLSEIANVNRGVRVVKKQLLNEGYPVFQNSLSPMGFHTEFNRDGEETYVISAGAAGEVGYCSDRFWAADDCLVFDNLKGVINKYLYYALLNGSEFLHRKVRRASIPRLSREVVEEVIILLPTKQRQREIIETLDKFDKICNDKTEGIPAEIAIREKQYEYYRNRLFVLCEAQ